MQVAVSAREEAGEAMKKGVAGIKRMTCSEIDDALLSKKQQQTNKKENLYSSINNTHPHEGNHRIVTTLSTSQSRYSLHQEYYAATTQPDTNNCSILARTSSQAHYYQHLIVSFCFTTIICHREHMFK